MTTVYALDGIVPVVAPDAFVHPSAVLIGDVIVASGAYIGPFASVRGDFGRCVVGIGANVQDHCMMHCFPGQDCVVEADGHIGHGAILHGCVVGADALVGMNAVVMDGARIGTGAVVAAHAFVKSGMEIPDGVLAAGTPARVLRPVTAEERAAKQTGTRDYQALVGRCHASLVVAQALGEATAERMAQRMAGGASRLKARG